MYDYAVIIPCFNESQILPQTYAAIVNFFQKENWRNTQIAVVFVNDGSEDDSHAVIRGFPQQPDEHLRVAALSYQKNKGKGFAIRHAVRTVRAQHYAFIDADLVFPLETLEQMYTALQADTNLVIGQRKSADHPSFYARFRSFVSRKLQRFVAAVVGVGFIDTQCGVKAFDKKIAEDVFPQLQEDRFAFDVELILAARKNDHRIAPHPVTFSYNLNSSVTTKDGLQYIVDILKLSRRK